MNPTTRADIAHYSGMTASGQLAGLWASLLPLVPVSRITGAKPGWPNDQYQIFWFLSQK
jgi:hypothetical protein